MVRVTSLIALLLVASQAAFAGNYFPNRSTDSLTYQHERFQDTPTASVDSTYGGWRHWTQFAGLGPMWVWTSSASEKVYIYSNGQIVLFADLAAAVDSGWDFGGNVPGYTSSSIRSRGLAVFTRGGTFRDCVLLSLSFAGNDAGTYSIYFAPGMGIVQWYQDSIAGPWRFDLLSGTVGGLSYPRPARAGLQVSGWIDQYEYFEDTDQLNPAGPTALTASITVKNSTTRPIPMWFISGQSYDIAIVDSNGNQVAIWSANRRFTNPMRMLSLAPGQSWTFSDYLKLLDMNGNRLPAGQYKVRMWLTTIQSVETDYTVQVTDVQPQ